MIKCFHISPLHICSSFSTRCHIFIDVADDRAHAFVTPFAFRQKSRLPFRAAAAQRDVCHARRPSRQNVPCPPTSTVFAAERHGAFQQRVLAEKPEAPHVALLRDKRRRLPFPVPPCTHVAGNAPCAPLSTRFDAHYEAKRRRAQRAGAWRRGNGMPMWQTR